MIQIWLGNYLEVILLELLSDPDEIKVSLVETVTVPDDLVDVSVELGGGSVESILEVVFNLCQVHRLFDDFKVLRNA